MDLNHGHWSKECTTHGSSSEAKLLTQQQTRGSCSAGHVDLSDSELACSHMGAVYKKLAQPISSNSMENGTLIFTWYPWMENYFKHIRSYLLECKGCPKATR